VQNQNSHRAEENVFTSFSEVIQFLISASGHDAAMEFPYIRGLLYSSRAWLSIRHQSRHFVFLDFFL
jgi:hypothetical protein